MAKEKRVSADGLNRAYVRSIHPDLWNKILYYLSDEKTPYIREIHLQSNMSEKEPSIFWKDLIIGTRKPGTHICLCPLDQLCK